MKDWLEKQVEKEEVLLDAASEQYRTLLDELLPQVRLAAIENDMEATVQISAVFLFEEDAITITTEGRVLFPAKITEMDSVTI